MTKNDLANLLKCFDVVQQSGKIESKAMLPMGITYHNASKLLENMGDGDVLIVFTPDAEKKSVESIESEALQGEQSPNQAETEPDAANK